MFEWNSDEQRYEVRVRFRFSLYFEKTKTDFFLCSLENYHSTYWFGSLCVCVCVWWGGVDMSTPLLAKFSVGRATSYHQILPTDAHHYQVFP
jgi:hypothetical protein